MRVLIVANADNSIFTNWTTYGQYVSGTLKTSVFNASALVKVGISDVTTLTYGQTNRDTNIYVSLNQLSAKIIYEGVYNEEGDKEESFSLAEVSGINMQSQVSIFNTSQVENTAYTPGSVSNTNTFYTYETLSEVNNIVLSVNKKGVSKAQEYKFAANKFIKGNLYKIKGNYIPLISFSITWVVEDMGRQPVTIPDFE